MTETHEQRVERLARAVCVADGLHDGHDDGGEIFDADPDLREAYRRTARAIIASDREAGLVTVPADLLKDCADDLEAWVRFAYPEDSRKYPSEARRYVRDMLPVARLRAALAAHEQEESQDAP